MDEMTPNPKPAASQDLGLISRIINVFAAPQLTFRAVQIRPAWVIPLIVLILIGVLVGEVVGPIAMREQTEKAIDMLRARDMSQEQIDAAMQAMENNPMTKAMRHPVARALVIVLVSLLSVFFLAALWLLVGKVIFEGRVTFGQMLGLVTYHSFISTLGGLIKLPLMVAKSSVDVHFSLATFLNITPTGFLQNFFYALMSKIEIFSIWSLAVLAIGLAVLVSKPLKSVLPWVIGIYAIYYLGSSAFYALGAMLGGM
ncbi:MAG TPA: YIP1 family protein [bacterium]|nr:YIP1 family protein [bacterium]HPG44087.1 YIP1 family protein [bacterium]HPM96453.1 YIP1 family protein [bacterium]